MLSIDSEKTIGKFLAFGSAAITVFVLTGSVSDPVNATKFLLLGGTSVAALAIFLSGGWKTIKDRRVVILVSALFVISSINAVINSDAPFEQNIYGTYGRNTGFLTYLFLVLILVSATSLREAKSFRLRPRIMIQSALPRKISKLINIESVPQTDTGDQVD